MIKVYACVGDRSDPRWPERTLFVEDWLASPLQPAVFRDGRQAAGWLCEYLRAWPEAQQSRRFDWRCIINNITGGVPIAGGLDLSDGQYWGLCVVSVPDTKGTT